MSNQPFSFISGYFIEHSVNGQPEKFYPISTRSLFKLRSIAKPLATALQVLFSGTDDDVARESVETSDASRNYQKRTAISAINPDLAQKRYEQKQKALEQLLDSVLSDETSQTLALLIMDSMRDRGFPKTPSAPQLAEFLGGLEAPTLLELLTGVVKANQRLFDPLRQRAAEIAAALKRRVEERLGPISAEVQPKPSEEKPTATSGT